MSKPTMTYRLGDREVNRLGYGAMQLAGPGVFGPVKDEARAIQVLRDAVASGVNHIDTSDFYGPHETNRLIKRRCIPIPTTCASSLKLALVGMKRADGSWPSARRS